MFHIETFLKNYTETMQALEKRGLRDTHAKSGMHALLSALRYSDKIIFTEGTMKMLIDKLRDPKETLAEIRTHLGERSYAEIMQGAQTFRGALVLFPKPINQVSALLSFVPSVYLPTGRDDLQLYLMSDASEVADVIFQRRGQWFYDDLYHRCARCTTEAGVRILCEQCRFLLDAWANIFGFSAVIAAQYLAAMRYEEQTTTIMRRTRREKSGKERRQAVKYTYKVIDANEIVIPIRESSDLPHEKRGSWIGEDTVYEEIRTRPFQRTYRHERYVNMRGQTVSFPDGIIRQQPRKKERIGRSFTKVKASLYESPEA